MAGISQSNVSSLSLRVHSKDSDFLLGGTCEVSLRSPKVRDKFRVGSTKLLENQIVQDALEDATQELAKSHQRVDLYRNMYARHASPSVL